MSRWQPALPAAGCLHDRLRHPKPKFELDFVNFHTFCHTYGTCMRRDGKRDINGLVGAGRWKSEQSAARYALGAGGRRGAMLLPVAKVTHKG